MRRTTADEYIVVEEIPGEGEAFFSVLPVTPGDRDEQLKETAEYLGAQAWVWARLANTDTVPASDMEEIVTLLIKKYPMIFQPQLWKDRIEDIRVVLATQAPGLQAKISQCQQNFDDVLDKIAESSREDKEAVKQRILLKIAAPHESSDKAKAIWEKETARRRQAKRRALILAERMKRIRSRRDFLMIDFLWTKFNVTDAAQADVEAHQRKTLELIHIFMTQVAPRELHENRWTTEITIAVDKLKEIWAKSFANEEEAKTFSQTVNSALQEHQRVYDERRAATIEFQSHEGAQERHRITKEISIPREYQEMAEIVIGFAVGESYLLKSDNIPRNLHERLVCNNVGAPIAGKRKDPVVSPQTGGELLSEPIKYTFEGPTVLVKEAAYILSQITENEPQIVHIAIENYKLDLLGDNDPRTNPISIDLHDGKWGHVMKALGIDPSLRAVLATQTIRGRSPRQIPLEITPFERLAELSLPDMSQEGYHIASQKNNTLDIFFCSDEMLSNRDVILNFVSIGEGFGGSCLADAKDFHGDLVTHLMEAEGEKVLSILPYLDRIEGLGGADGKISLGEFQPLWELLQGRAAHHLRHLPLPAEAGTQDVRAAPVWERGDRSKQGSTGRTGYREAGEVEEDLIGRATALGIGMGFTDFRNPAAVVEKLTGQIRSEVRLNLASEDGLGEDLVHFARLAGIDTTSGWSGLLSRGPINIWDEQQKLALIDKIMLVQQDHWDISQWKETKEVSKRLADPFSATRPAETARLSMNQYGVLLEEETLEDIASTSVWGQRVPVRADAGDPGLERSMAMAARRSVQPTPDAEIWTPPKPGRPPRSADPVGKLQPAPVTRQEQEKALAELREVALAAKKNAEMKAADAYAAYYEREGIEESLSGQDTEETGKEVGWEQLTEVEVTIAEAKKKEEVANGLAAAALEGQVEAEQRADILAKELAAALDI